MSKPNRYIDRERYFLELAQTSERYLLPYIRQYKDLPAGCRVLEIGCGEGGLLYPFAQQGCTVTGFDLSEGKVENARQFFAARQTPGSFFCADALAEGGALEGQYFDLILIHDVIEHIEPEDKLSFLQKAAARLAPDGVLYMGFPAWRMPFGGHQQVCRSRLASHLPYTHALPLKAYMAYLKRCGEDEGKRRELASIYRSRMSVESFEQLCREVPLRVVNRTLWLINPHYQVKFHMHPLRMPGFLAAVPHLRNWFATSCFFILRHQ